MKIPNWILSVGFDLYGNWNKDCLYCPLYREECRKDITCKETMEKYYKVMKYKENI